VSLTLAISQCIRTLAVPGDLAVTCQQPCSHRWLHKV